MNKANVTIPIIACKRYRLSFQDQEVIGNLETMDPKFRSYFVEMALTDWADKNPGISTRQLMVTAASTDQLRRFRLRIKNAKVVALLDSLSPKFRSNLTETVVREWIKQPSGVSTFKVFALRSGRTVPAEGAKTDETVTAEREPVPDPVMNSENDRKLLMQLQGGFR